MISEVHWYPTDLGMATFSTYSGCIRVWDLHSSQILGTAAIIISTLTFLDLFAVRDTVHDYAFSRLPSACGRSIMALATSSGVQVYDFQAAKRVLTLLPQSLVGSKNVTALNWDAQRSDFILFGTYIRISQPLSYNV